MKRRKFYACLTLALALLLLVSAAACAKSENSVPAPSFTLQSVDGAFVNLSDFRNRPVMLVFWRINCSACQFQMPFTQELFDKFSSDSLAVITINVGDRASEVKDYMTSRKITYPVLLDTQGAVAESYAIIGVPTTYFIDSRGLLKSYMIGAFKSERDMETTINEVFPDIVLNPKISTSAQISNTPETKTGPEVGNSAPDFTLRTTDNQTISLSGLRGKTVLLNFWMSTCDACVSELRYLQTASDNLSSKPVIILAVNCGESSLAAQSVVDRLNLSLPVLLDPDGKICTTYKHGAPTTFLIDTSGIIKAIKDDAFENPNEVYSMLNSVQ